MYEVGILTVSDRCSAGEQEDKSGPAIASIVMENYPGSKIEHGLVPDEVEEIQTVLRKWATEEKHLILTTGGTGFAPRDITPEATKPLLEKECPGIVVAMLTKSLSITPMAALSRPAAGIRNKTLIINLPGSTKGAVENFQAVVRPIPHAISLITQSADKNKHN